MYACMYLMVQDWEIVILYMYVFIYLMADTNI